MSSRGSLFQCFTTFSAELAELREMRELFVAAKSLFTKYGYVLKREATIKYWYEEEQIGKRVDPSATRESTINKSVLILAWGSFEQFIRNLVREAAELRNKNGWSEGIPEKVKNQHSIICANVISSDIRGELGYLSIVQSAVATDMRNLICTEGSPKLNSEALAAIGGRFREDELIKLGARVGIDLSWEKLGENSDLRTCSEKNGRDAVGKWAQALFCDIRDARNCFSHMGAGATNLEWRETERYISFLELLAKAIEAIAASEVSS